MGVLTEMENALCNESKQVLQERKEHKAEIAELKKEIKQEKADFEKMINHAVNQSLEIRELKEKLDAKYREEELEDYMDEKVQVGDFWYKRSHGLGYISPKEKRAKERKKNGTSVPKPRE